jgi:2'-5' RNA ligase
LAFWFALCLGAGQKWVREGRGFRCRNVGFGVSSLRPKENRRKTVPLEVRDSSQELKGKHRPMRLFIALDIDDAIRERIETFMQGVAGFAPEVRWANSKSLHVTLKFIGEQPEPAVEHIRAALSTIEASSAEIHFRGLGFFPTTKSARVFWIGMEAGPRLAALATEIDKKMAPLGVSKEDRAFCPHLTLARGRGRSASPRRHPSDVPNRTFQCLQERLAALPTPDFGTLTARDFFLYQSRLSPQGSKYTKLARFDLK